jgi:hypothetical protein
MRHAGYLIVVAVAAMAPWISPRLGSSVHGRPEVGSTVAAPIRGFPGWPDAIAGRPVTRVPLGPDEAAFASAFPGEVARFSDGERHHILRWIREPTRRLHPASDCLRASGYALTPERLCPGADGLTVCYRASRGDTIVDVREHLFDDAGNHWPHVSEWYWSATVGQTDGPWWSLTTIVAAQP